MKKIALVSLLSIPMFVAASNCDQISANIAEKIQKNGVKPSLFQLKLIPTEQSKQQIEGKIVGTCDGGKQKIIYVRFDRISTATKASKSTPTSPTIEDVKSLEKSQIDTQKQETQASALESQEQPEVESVPETSQDQESKAN